MDRRKIGFAGVTGRLQGRTYAHTHVTNQIFRYPTKIDALTQLEQLIKPGRPESFGAAKSRRFKPVVLSRKFIRKTNKGARAQTGSGQIC